MADANQILLGNTAKHLRKSLSLTQEEAAEKLGITNVYLSNIENDKATPSSELLGRFREVFGVDLYVLAWCRHGNVEELPHAVRQPMKALANAWEKELERIAKGVCTTE